MKVQLPVLMGRPSLSSPILILTPLSPGDQDTRGVPVFHARAKNSRSLPKVPFTSRALSIRPPLAFFCFSPKLSPWPLLSSLLFLCPPTPVSNPAPSRSLAVGRTPASTFLVVRRISRLALSLAFRQTTNVPSIFRAASEPNKWRVIVSKASSFEGTELVVLR